MSTQVLAANKKIGTKGKMRKKLVSDRHLYEATGAWEKMSVEQRDCFQRRMGPDMPQTPDELSGVCALLAVGLGAVTC